MWEINSYDQSISFLFSLGLGAVFCVLYDIIRSMRKVCLNSFLAVTIVDILLWIVYAFLTFIFLISRTNGEIRGYVIFGEFVGFVLFRISVSKFLYLLLSFIFEKIALIKFKINKVVDAFYIKIELYILKMIKYIFKFFKSVKKLLKNTYKLLYTDKNIVNLENISNETKTET